MIKLGLKTYSFTEIKEAVNYLFPDVKVEHLCTDTALKNLGLVETAPYSLLLDLDEAGFEEMLDDLMQLEVDAFNTDGESGVENNSQSYQLYLRYGWLWSTLENAMIEEWVEAKGGRIYDYTD